MLILLGPVLVLLLAGLVAVALLAAATLIADERSLRSQTPHQLPAAFTLGVLAVVIVVKETLP